MFFINLFIYVSIAVLTFLGRRYIEDGIRIMFRRDPSKHRGLAGSDHVKYESLDYPHERYPQVMQWVRGDVLVLNNTKRPERYLYLGMTETGTVLLTSADRLGGANIATYEASIDFVMKCFMRNERLEHQRYLNVKSNASEYSSRIEQANKLAHQTLADQFNALNKPV